MDLGQLFALLKHDAMAISSYRLNASSYASATESSCSALDMSRNNYPYSPPAGYSGNNGSSPPPSGYPPYGQGSGRPYYPATSAARGGQPTTQYYTPIAPAPPSDRYSSTSYGSPEYSSPPAYPPSQYPDNRGSGGYQSNPPGSGSYPYPAPRAISPPVPYPRPHQQPPNFIQTPKDAYASSRPPRPQSAMARGSGHGPYASPPHAHALPPPSSRQPHAGPSRPRGTAPLPSSSGERFPCEVCGKDFSRAHDRKRHHETQHAATPVTHKCRHCDKDFSRADSLKRHLQNGCDEAPQ